MSAIRPRETPLWRISWSNTVDEFENGRGVSEVSNPLALWPSPAEGPHPGSGSLGPKFPHWGPGKGAPQAGVERGELATRQ